LKKGGKIRAYDPIATENVQKLFPQVEYVDSVYDVSDGADALMLVTEWNEFRQLDLNRLGKCMKRKVLFDGRKVYRQPLAERAGFEYLTIGK